MSKKLKTAGEVERARITVVRVLENPDISHDQQLVAMGMSVALAWVANDGGNTLQRLIDGTKVVAGRTTDDVIRNMTEAN